MGPFIERLIDDDPKNLHRWRVTVGYVLMSLLIIVVFNTSALTAGVPIPGRGRVIHETEIQKHVDAAVQPVKDDVAKIKDQQAKDSEKLDAVLEQVNESLAQTKAAEIRELVYKRCHIATYEEREPINAEIERKQIEYKKLRGEPYDKPTCAEL